MSRTNLLCLVRRCRPVTRGREETLNTSEKTWLRFQWRPWNDTLNIFISHLNFVRNRNHSERTRTGIDTIGCQHPDEKHQDVTATLTPRRRLCLGAAVFFVTGWPLFRPTAMGYRTAITVEKHNKDHLFNIAINNETRASNVWRCHDNGGNSNHWFVFYFTIYLNLCHRNSLLDRIFYTHANISWVSITPRTTSKSYVTRNGDTNTIANIASRFWFSGVFIVFINIVNTPPVCLTDHI